MTDFPGLIRVDHRHVCGEEGVSNRPAVLVGIMKVKLVDQLIYLDSEEPRSPHSLAPGSLLLKVLWSGED